jgi:hypothetical protein
MALDPNIALGVRGIELPNQLAQYGQIAQIQQAQQANQLNALKMQEAQANMEERNALRQLNPTSADYESQLFKLNPQLGIAFRKEASAAAASKAQQQSHEATTAQKKQEMIGQAYRDISSRPDDENIISHTRDILSSPFYDANEKAAVQARADQMLRIPIDQRQSFLAQQGAKAGELRPQVVAPSGSLVQNGKSIFTAPAAPPTPSPTNRLLQERAALLESGVPRTDPRIQAYDQALAAGESQSAKMQRELQVAIANNAPPAVIAQIQRDIRNLHPGLAMQNVVGVDANGNQIVTRFAGAGNGPQGQFALNQSPTGTARAMLGLNDTDSALLFGPGGPVESGQIPVSKLNAANAKMYVAAIKANPTLNLASLTEDQILAASKARAQGSTQGKQVLTIVDRATAQNIANGNIPPLTGPNSSKIMNEVIAMKPDFKASDYGLQTSAVKAFNQGIQGNKVRSLNVVMEHFNTLEKAADALQSGDVRAINAVSQYIQTQTGKPAPSNFNAVKEILADEIVAAVVPGTGALADRVALKKTILASVSPEQLKGVVANYKELIGGQLTGLEKQYSAGTGRADFKSRYLTSAAVQGLAPSSQYVETKTLPDGRTLGKKADGTVEEIK